LLLIRLDGLQIQSSMVGDNVLKFLIATLLDELSSL